ncbi:MAG: TetR/AcrR family transcriptional regulator [Myxococcales bacterium]|nr:TetR/AcrR family transcriptional regulator [Myxococcales bacterium]MCB9576459.1 TetR/AcrR family transcriptional regulator [Polyangiaceae bacterium]
MEPRAKRPRPSSDRILAAAEREFARRGYGETSLRQLMSAAKVSTTAFYARFATKEDVLRQLVLGLLSDLDERARAELSAAESVEDGFRRGVDVLVSVMAPKQRIVRIALTEGAASPAVRETLSQLYAALAALLGEKLAALARRGDATADDPEAVAWSLVGALNLQITRWAVYEQLSTDELAPALHRVATAMLPLLKR